MAMTRERLDRGIVIAMEEADEGMDPDGYGDTENRAGKHLQHKSHECLPAIFYVYPRGLGHHFEIPLHTCQIGAGNRNLLAEIYATCILLREQYAYSKKPK